MKDATGELSMTAVAVVAIAAIAALFSTLIWPTIRTNIMRSSYCSASFDCSCPEGEGMCDCYYCEASDDGQFEAKCDNPTPISCPQNDVN